MGFPLTAIAARVGHETVDITCMYGHMLYGTTIYEFVLACRIDRAKELLADQEKKISEIATLVGYERQSSFSAAFHQRTGITPNEFRRQLGN